MAGPDWPELADLERKLGLQPGDDTENVQSALDGAQADAVFHGIDPTTPALDAGQFEAVLGLGTWYYQDRNRAPDYSQQGAFAVNAPTRTRYLQIITRGKVAIA